MGSKLANILIIIIISGVLMDWASGGEFLRQVKYSLSAQAGSGATETKRESRSYISSLKQKHISLNEISVTQQVLVTGSLAGVLIAVAAYFWIASVAMLDSLAWGLTCFLFPPAVLVYTISGISTRSFRPLLVFGCGCIIASCCGALFVISVV